MFFEFVPDTQFDFVSSFAKKFNLPLEGDRLVLPPALGTGSIRRVSLSAGMKLIVHRYQLHQEFIINRVGNEGPNDLVSIIFHSNEDAGSVDTGGTADVLSRRLV